MIRNHSSLNGFPPTARGNDIDHVMPECFHRASTLTIGKHCVSPNGFPFTTHGNDNATLLFAYQQPATNHQPPVQP